MGFLTTQDILKKLDQASKSGTKPLVDTFDKKRVESAHYELSLGGTYFVSENKAQIKTKSDQEIITIPSGQIAFLETKEDVNLPNDVLAFISIKATHKLKGLVNISGFHVDPGYSGKLLYSVFNSSPSEIKLEIGSKLFLIWFYQLDENDSVPFNGDPKRLTEKVTADIKDEFPSNNILDKQFKDLKIEFENLKRDYKTLRGNTIAIVGTLLIPLFMTLIPMIIPSCSKDSPKEIHIKETIIKRESEPAHTQSNQIIKSSKEKSVDQQSQGTNVKNK